MSAAIAVTGLLSLGADARAGDEPAPLPAGTLTRIAFGSCAKHWQAQPIWQAVLAAQPDLWLLLGDAIYADTDGRTAWAVSEKTLAGEWNRLADSDLEIREIAREVGYSDSANFTRAIRRWTGEPPSRFRPDA